MGTRSFQWGVPLNSLPRASASACIQNLPYDLVASITAQRVERAPKPAELFSRGPHDATATFDIGNPNLNIEVANSVEVGLRRATGPLRFEATAYYTRFNGFIFRRLTGVMCDETFDTCGDPAAELNQAVYSQRDAIFRGGEFQAQYDVAKVLNGVWGVEGQFDVVRATFTDGTNVPRIPPVRLGGGVVLPRLELARAREPDPRVSRRTMLPSMRRRRPATICSRRRSATPGSWRAPGSASHVNSRSAWSATIFSTRTSATASPTPRTKCSCRAWA